MPVGTLWLPGGGTPGCIYLGGPPASRRATAPTRAAAPAAVAAEGVTLEDNEPTAAESALAGRWGSHSRTPWGDAEEAEAAAEAAVAELEAAELANVEEAMTQEDITDGL